MDIPLQLPLDHDGFLRRECPHCAEEFKWHDGPATEEAESHGPVSAYYCPLCGKPAGPDSWWTQAQISYIEGVAAPAALRYIGDELSRAFSKMNSKNFRVKTTGHIETPDEPDPLTEPDDMGIIASPCHGYEPVKVPTTAPGPYYCLVCGAAFAA